MQNKNKEMNSQKLGLHINIPQEVSYVSI